MSTTNDGYEFLRVQDASGKRANTQRDVAEGEGERAASAMRGMSAPSEPLALTVAHSMQQACADAWQAGYGAGQRDMMMAVVDQPPTRNPYSQNALVVDEGTKK